MSLLDTIEIQGVRSIGIGSQNAAVVEFLSPLTIICGSNGSGKTTIIESLKYATTGDLPSGKMPVFIHDHRLANRTRVDASVRLKFKDVRGRPCTVTRRMTARVEGSKGKLVTKSEEATIAVQNEFGDWKSLSSKVGDMKKEILNLLGVPAAILEYVVFCHQEESTWPLDEPKKLKERFDEIFQVTSYVKSIDALKKIQKQNQQELKTLEVTLPHLVRQQESKLKLQGDCKNLRETIEKNERQILDGVKAIEQQQLDLEKARKNVVDAEEVERDYKGYEKEIILLTEQIDGLTVPDYQGTVSDLEREINTYKKIVENNEEYVDYEKNRVELSNEINGLAVQIKELVAKKDHLQEEISELKASLLVREKLCEEEDALVKSFSEKFSCAGTELNKKLHEVLEGAEKELRDLQCANKEKELACLKEANELSAELAVLENKIETNSEKCKNIESEIINYNGKIAAAESNIGQSADLQGQVNALEERLKEMSLGGGGETKLKELKMEREELNSKIAHLREECRMSECAETISVSLNDKKKKSAELESQLGSLLSKHEQALSDVFNGKKPDFPIKGQVAAVLKRVGKAISHADEIVHRHEKERSKLSSDVEHLNERIEQLSDDIYARKSRIEKVVPYGDSVEVRLEEVKSLLNKSRSDLGLIDGCRYLYEKWEREGKERKCCPLCERKYKTADETTEFIKKVSQRRSELPNEISKLQRRVAEHEELQKELMEVAPFTTILKELESQKVTLEEDLVVAEKKLSMVEEEVSKSVKEKELMTERQNHILSVQADGSLMDNIWDCQRELNKQVSRLSMELDSKGSCRAVSEVRNEMDEFEKRNGQILEEMDIIQIKEKERNDIVGKLNNLRAQCIAIAEETMMLETLKKKILEKEDEKAKCVAEIDKLEAMVPAMKTELDAKLASRASVLEHFKDEERKITLVISELEGALEKLTSLRSKIEGTKDSLKKLTERQSLLKGLSQEVEEKNEECRVLNSKLDNVNTQQERIRRLDDQLRKIKLRERISALSELKKEIELSGTSIDELKKIVRKAEKNYNSMELALERKKGEVQQKKIQLAEMESRLRSKEFLNSEEEYKKTVVNKCVTEKVVEDLSSYIRILDESVVKYHMQKMGEINEILGQLWDQVYRGNDIETIQIKSETVDEGEKRKSYNYRVVMTVDGSEIDMPGRCSAGQKMLASILIRIALSDVFCDRCSIIALDEPTTNLDVLKVENLGDMLAEIIEARCASNKKNFQLIVITHDDRFVEHLRQLCRPEWVYALAKDGSGLSRVKRHRTMEDARMQ